MPASGISSTMRRFPGLQVTVTDHGTLSHGMKRRRPGQKQPTWHKAGDVHVAPKRNIEDDIETKDIEHGAGVLLIIEAPNAARSRLDQMGRKVDPKAAEKAQKAEAAAAGERWNATRFSVVVQAFDDLHLSTLAKAGENSRIVRQIYGKVPQERPIKDHADRRPRRHQAARHRGQAVPKRRCRTASASLRHSCLAPSRSCATA